MSPLKSCTDWTKVAVFFLMTNNSYLNSFIGEAISQGKLKLLLYVQPGQQNMNIADIVCTRHANAGIVSNAIEAGAFILAGIWCTLIDILFTARPSITSDTVTREGTLSVHTLTTMFTRVGTWGKQQTKGFTCERKQPGNVSTEERWFLTYDAFISVLVAGAAYITRWAITVEVATDGIGVTLSALSTGVTNTGIVVVAKQAWKNKKLVIFSKFIFINNMIKSLRLCHYFAGWKWFVESLTIKNSLLVVWGCLLKAHEWT